MQKDVIYEQFYNKVLNYVNSKVNNINIAEEIASDVFVKVYENIDNYDETKASLSTWIYTITKHTLIDYYRTRKIQTEISEEIPDKESIEDEVVKEEELARLADALEKLDVKERQVVVSYYYSGKKLKDIAETMGVSYTYIKKVHQKAVAKLNELMSTTK